MHYTYLNRDVSRVRGTTFIITGVCVQYEALHLLKEWCWYSKGHFTYYNCGVCSGSGTTLIRTGVWFQLEALHLL